MRKGPEKRSSQIDIPKIWWLHMYDKLIAYLDYIISIMTKKRLYYFDDFY